MGDVEPKVLLERMDRVLLITLNRPEVSNALDRELSDLVDDALAAARRDPDVSVIVITGAGELAFCSGMDLAAIARGEGFSPENPCVRPLMFEVFPKPVVAAVNGAAVAGGMELMMSCDLVVAAEHARFGLPEVRRGLVAGLAAHELPLRLPLPIAMEIGLLGGYIGAHEAQRLGLINRVVTGPEVLPTALAIAEELAQNAPLALAATKQLMREALKPIDPQRLTEVLARVASSADAHEGASAFLAKREPAWAKDPHLFEETNSDMGRRA